MPYKGEVEGNRAGAISHQHATTVAPALFCSAERLPLSPFLLRANNL